MSAGPCAATIGSGSGTAFAFGADGSRYLALAGGGIRIMGAGSNRTVAERLHVQDFTVRSDGDVYAVAEAGGIWSELWLIAEQARCYGSTTV